jgi:hypothetical protein
MSYSKIKTTKPGYQPREYVFQGYDGFIYGDVTLWTPQEVGRINAQNRKDQAQGTWLPKASLTEAELSKRPTPPESTEGFKSPCPLCGRL